MSIVYRCLGLLMVVLLLPSVTVGEDEPEKHPPQRLQLPLIDASAAGKKAIELYDADKDGSLNGKELDKCPGLKACVAKVDTDKDGKITPLEIADRIRAWQATRTGLTSCACRVTHNGKALSGAEIKFVPEKFLGDNLKAAEGVTNKNGMAMISIPDLTVPGSNRKLRGIALGMYRVEITKDGEKIPAKYNTETILGQEIAPVIEAMDEGITFDLDY